MIDLIRQRRSCRQFTAEKVSDEAVALLIEAALRSPSSRGLNPWQFVVVDDKTTIASLAGVKAHGSAFLKGAPLVLAVFADPERCDVWIEDCAIATIMVQMEAESLDLGSCWVQIRKRKDADEVDSEERVRGILGIPENFRVLSLIGIGHPVKRLAPHPPESLQRKKIHHNRFGEA